MQKVASSRLVLVLAALLVGSAAYAQGLGSFGEYLEIQLVNVEVFAVDRDGEPVLDLERGDFRIYEDGEPVEVSLFSPPPAGRPTADAPGGSSRGTGSAAEGALVALFVDNVNTGPMSRSRVFDQLREVLDAGLGENDRVMVATYDGSLEIRLPFTSSRKELRRALGEIENFSGGRLSAGVREQRVLDLIGWHQEQQTLAPSGDPCVHVGNMARTHADEVYNEVQGTISALSDFVDSLAGIPGRKVLIHVSDGIPLTPGAEAFQFAIELCDGTGANERVLGAIDIDRSLSGDGRLNRFNPQAARFDLLQYDTTEEWQRLAAVANAQRVVFYPVFAAGLAPPSRSQVDAVRTTFHTGMERQRNDQEPLTLLARETGGEAFINTNDFRPGFRQVLDETRFSYTLAYAAPEPGDGRRHRIRVEVDRPGVRLRHRTGYQAKTLPERVADGVLSALLYGVEENPLDIRLEAEAQDRSVGHRRLTTVRVHVPLESLTLMPGEERRRGLFTIYLAARLANGDRTPVGRRSIPVSLSEQSPESDEYVYEVEIELVDGKNDVAVALRDEVGGQVSYLRVGVDTASG